MIVLYSNVSFPKTTVNIFELRLEILFDNHSFPKVNLSKAKWY